MDEKVVRASVIVETESQKDDPRRQGRRDGPRDRHRARPEIEALLGHKIYLELQVKVRPKWRRDEAMLERLGL